MESPNLLLARKQSSVSQAWLPIVPRWQMRSRLPARLCALGYRKRHQSGYREAFEKSRLLWCRKRQAYKMSSSSILCSRKEGISDGIEMQNQGYRGSQRRDHDQGKVRQGSA